jgi:hypothetical protein
VAGSVAGVVAVVVELVSSGPSAELVVVAMDLVVSATGVVQLAEAPVDLVSYSAALRASSIIAVMSMATNLFFISNFLSLNQF